MSLFDEGTKRRSKVNHGVDHKTNGTEKTRDGRRGLYIVPIVNVRNCVCYYHYVCTSCPRNTVILYEVSFEQGMSVSVSFCVRVEKCYCCVQFLLVYLPVCIVILVSLLSFSNHTKPIPHRQDQHFQSGIFHHLAVECVHLGG